MVWRNDKDRNRRRLPSIPLESKTVPTLTRLSLESMLPAVATSDESIERPTLLIMDGHNVDQVPFSRNSRQFWSPTIARSFPVHSTQRRELPSEEELESFDNKNITNIYSPIRTSNRRRMEIFQRNLFTNRQSDKHSLRQNISNSFDSSYLSVSSAKNFSHELLAKPESVTTLEKTAQKMNSLKSTTMFDNDQKKNKSRPSITVSLSLQSKVNSQNSKKITRRPRSSDITKTSSQTGSSGSSSRKSDRVSMTPTLQRSSTGSSTKSPSISPNSQSIILFCMDNARSDIGLRIIQRMAHKRDDFAQFYGNLSNEQSNELVMELKKFLTDIVRNIGNSEKIRQISNRYGIEQAHKRSWGFKADFFSLLADALTTECVFLDGAAHQPTETIEAWATLVELMFTNVRDGYYMETRQLRRNWQNFNSQSNLSSQSDQSLDGDSLQSPSSLHHMFTTV